MPSIIPIPALTDNYIRIRSAHRNCHQAQRDRSRLAVPASIAGERAAECLCVPGNLHGSPLPKYARLAASPVSQVLSPHGAS
jgi:hypothetical protein